MRFTITLIIALAVALPLACSSRQGQLQANAQAANDPSSAPGRSQIESGYVGLAIRRKDGS